MIDALFEREEMLIVVVLYTKTQFVQYLCVVVCVNVKPLTETAAIFFASSWPDKAALSSANDAAKKWMFDTHTRL